ncbi:MAG TPA: flippase [Sedimentisphaerales bacterium]|nr:flippase [Sedimentisphaerales bacterium]
MTEDDPSGGVAPAGDTMRNELKTTWGRNRRVIDSFVSLSVVQFANYMAPLITLPYLFRVLGPARFGLVELARVITVYFLLLTDYSFSLSATREISIRRDDPARVSEVFSAVLVLRFLLVVLSAAILSLVVWTVPRLRADWPVYYLSFVHVLGMWLFPVWLFQGLERMKPIATLNVAAKTLVIAGIFILVRNEEDYLYVPLLQSSGAVVVGLAGLVIALSRFGVRFRMPPTAVLKREFLDGWHLFVSKMATTMYTTSNTVILGLFTDLTFVAYYAAGDKIVRAVQGLQLPLSQAIFPHIGRLASQSRQAALVYAGKIARLVSVATLAMSAGLFFTAPYITRAVQGQPSAEGTAVIRILSALPFIIGLSNIFGIQILVNFGREKTLTRILLAAGILNIALAMVLVLPLQHVGVATAAVTAEAFVTVALFLAMRRSGLDIFRARRG